jgi:hypothetical protein
MTRIETTDEHARRVADAYSRFAGNVSAMARDTGLSRGAIRDHMAKLGIGKKPLVAGKLKGVVMASGILPAKGLIKRYLLTSAQNNTAINKKVWANFLALAEHYNAEIMVGTYSYNQNHFGSLAVKRGKDKAVEHTLWFAPEIVDYICDKRVELGTGLVWCGEMNILPTAVDPLSGLETYSHRKSAIFPHAKLAMRSIPTMLGEGTKLNYTTGTITLRNYIQKKEGLKAEHHHRYSCLIVEVNHDGYWCVRQVGANSAEGDIQDLQVIVRGGEVTSTDASVEAITWGDLHAGWVEPWVVNLSMEMLDTLRPKYQFLHDVLEGASINRHERKSPHPHHKFSNWLRGLHRLDAELALSKEVIERYLRPWCQTIVPDSNHDGWWLASWLNEFDYRKDPGNAELFLKMQLYSYERIRLGVMVRDVNLIGWAFNSVGLSDDRIKFLLADESFKICDRKIECGMHGHLGPNGSRGTPSNLRTVGRRANTAHTHSAGIYDGLYVAGTSSKLRWDYNYGPTSWGHAHIVTYPNGQRSIITMYDGKWRAQ